MSFTTTWMQLKIATPSKSERERQIPYDITCTWNLNYGTNELIYEAETESQPREHTGGCQEAGA